MVNFISNQNLSKWDKLELYNNNVADWIFKLINNSFQYQAWDIIANIKEMEDDGNIYSLLQPWMRLIGLCKSYCISNTILWTNEDNIEWLYFLIADVSMNNISESQCFEDAIIIPEQYRWWNVAINMYKVMIEFCKTYGIKKINSDTELSKWWNSIYEKLIKEWYNITKNESCWWSEDEQKLKSYDSYPIYIINI